jgi:(E)-4-hydroxy-3-methylbut-2-enyl-diphosphate synthase
VSVIAPRRVSRQVSVGGVLVGGGAPVSVQSMTSTRTEDVGATLGQIVRLADAGCDIVRVAVPGRAAAEALREIVAGSPIPVVADVHFDHRLALAAAAAGAHGLRINPGNVGGRERVVEVAAAARERGIPIRIGVNSGSLEDDILARDGKPSAAGMVESALRHAEILESVGFRDIVLSLKSSDVLMTVEANRAMAGRSHYPLHLGVTEAGTVTTGAVRSAVAMGILLGEGIGDTVRVSLAGPPEDEVRAARAILSSLGLRRRGVTVVACPTCGRTEIDVQGIAERVEAETAGIRADLVVAVMGCSVNGPGEAREADVGIAGGGSSAVLFRKGERIGVIEATLVLERLLSEIRAMADDDRPDSISRKGAGGVR